MCRCAAGGVPPWFHTMGEMHLLTPGFHPVFPCSLLMTRFRISGVTCFPFAHLLRSGRMPFLVSCNSVFTRLLLLVQMQMLVHGEFLMCSCVDSAKRVILL